MSDHAPARLAARFLDVIKDETVPLTRAGIGAGNKVFGAAIMRKSDLSTVVAATNGESENPLLHGEVAAINALWALPAASRPQPADCLFLATHEPCPLCLAAITWSGFDNFTYLFGYAATRDTFGIAHDLRIHAEGVRHRRWGLSAPQQLLARAQRR